MTADLLSRPLDSAVIDEAHLGDIEGAFGSVRWRQLWPPRTWRRRLLVLATVMGPGLLALVADNDAGGVATYAQAGQAQGAGLLWLLLPLGVVLFVNQEMAARLGAVSGVGHARLIFERFGRFWGTFSLADLVVLNVLTLVTEFIGVRYAAAHLGVSPPAAVGGAAALLLLATLTGSFRHWERVMYLLVAADIVLLPVLLIAHPTTAIGALGPTTVDHQAATAGVVLVVALVGTTVAPWQLFFQQSVVVDKRITPVWLSYERLDTAVGTLLMLAGAGAVLLVASAAFTPNHPAGIMDMGAILATIGQHLGSNAGKVVALLLLDGAVLGAAAVTLATSYAIGDVTGTRHSLHRTPDEAPLFYGMVACLIVGAAAVAVLPGIPIGAITVAVQVLAGLLLPSATVFLILLCNDSAVLGPWVNRPWLNALASTTVAALLVLSALLVVTTLFPSVRVAVLLPVLSVAAVFGLIGLALPRTRRRRTSPPAVSAVAPAPPALRLVRGGHLVVDRHHGARRPPDLERRTWRTPPLAELRRPIWTRGRLAGMVALRAYLVLSMAALLGRLVARALGH